MMNKSTLSSIALGILLATTSVTSQAQIAAHPAAPAIKTAAAWAATARAVSNFHF